MVFPLYNGYKSVDEDVFRILQVTKDVFYKFGLFERFALVI